MDLKFLFTLVCSFASLCITVGVYMTKLKQVEKDVMNLKEIHDKDVLKIENRQNTTDQLLQSINTQLTELNTKMSLLLRGKINVEGMTNG